MQVIKKILNWLKNILAIVGSLFLGYTLLVKLSKIDNSITKSDPFKPVKNDKTKIKVKDKNGKWKVVQLPDKVTSDKVVAVQYPENKKEKIDVKILHNTIDRRQP